VSPEEHRRAAALFHQICDLDLEAQSRALEQASREDPLVAAEVRVLLGHDAGEDDSLATHARWMEIAAELVLEEPPDIPPSTLPRRIGGYKIKRKLGAGGMGIVFEAIQDRPRRTVAVKILRSALISSNARRRFEREAQLLARLDHPGIARVFEASEHRGLPFFSMELVEGVPLTEYAKSAGLDHRQRLELFALLADAVHHAHMSGVLHRDLKPANILVTPSGKPKILDFGIARSLDNLEEEASFHTAAGQLLGTAAYMSPEQLTDPIGADARSDVYALGVIAYELLAGENPYGVVAPRLAEMERILTEREPIPLGRKQPKLAGDVETIVGKALEKDRARRYQSASELAEDVRRHLRDEPIFARAPTTREQIEKFTRRNKRLVAATIAIAVALVTGSVVVTTLYVRAVRSSAAERAARLDAERSRASAERETKKARAISGFLFETIGAANPESASSPNMTVDEVLTRAAARLDEGSLEQEPTVEASARLAVGSAYAGLMRIEEAEHHLEIALRLAEQTSDDETYAKAAGELGRLALEDGDLARGQALFETALARDTARVGPESVEVAERLRDLAKAISYQGQFDEAIPMIERALLILRSHGDEALDEVATTLHRLGVTQIEHDRLDDAEQSLDEALALDTQLHGAEHARVARDLNALSVLYRKRGRLDEAEDAATRALAMQRLVLGELHTGVAQTLTDLADIRSARGDEVKAEALLRDALDIFDKTYPPRHRLPSDTALQLGKLLRREGRLDEAEAVLRDVLSIRQEAFGDRSGATVRALGSLAHVLADRGEPGDWDEAEALLRRGIDIWSEERGPDHFLTGGAHSELGSGLIKMKRFAEAEQELLLAWDIETNALGEDDERPRRTADRMTRLYEAWGKPSDGALWRERARASR